MGSRLEAGDAERFLLAATFGLPSGIDFGEREIGGSCAGYGLASGNVEATPAALLPRFFEGEVIKIKNDRGELLVRYRATYYAHPHIPFSGHIQRPISVHLCETQTGHTAWVPDDEAYSLGTDRFVVLHGKPVEITGGMEIFRVVAGDIVADAMNVAWHQRMASPVQRETN